MPRNATRYFASPKDAKAFAETVGAKFGPVEKWNPMRDFGYEWQVDYDATLTGKEAPAQS